MVQRIGIDDVACLGESRQHCQVGHVASAEGQRAGVLQMRAFEFGQPVFEQRVGAAVATDQVRSAAAGAANPPELASRMHSPARAERPRGLSG